MGRGGGRGGLLIIPTIIGFELGSKISIKMLSPSWGKTDGVLSLKSFLT